MGDISASNWNQTDASNTAAAPDGAPEGMAPSGVNDTMRAMAGAIKRFWVRINGTLTSIGSGNAYVLTYGVAPTAYVAGEVYTFITNVANTGAATLNINSLGAKAITKNGATALASGDIPSGAVVTVSYDGTRFQLLNPGPANALPTQGTAGQVLTSNGAAASSFQDAPPPWKNVMLNGGMEVWQRGAQGSASIALAASSNGYTADRWTLAVNANQASTVSQQAGLTNTSRWCARVQRNAGQTGVVGSLFFEYPFTLDDCIRLRGKIVALSFTARSGADFSGGSLGVALYCGTGAAARRAAGGYTTETTPINSSAAITGTAARFTFASTAIPTTTTQMSLAISNVPSGTAGTNDYFEIDDVQMEIGAAATAFDIRPFYEELAKCQFHYRKTFPLATAPAQNAGTTGAPRFLPVKTAAGGAVWAWRFDYPMYASPTVTTFNPNAANANIRDVSAGTDITVAVVETTGGLTNIVGNSTMVVGNTLQVHVTAEAEI